MTLTMKSAAGIPLPETSPMTTQRMGAQWKGVVKIAADLLGGDHMGGDLDLWQQIRVPRQHSELDVLGDRQLPL
jgi:hypothetical protein